MTAEEKLMEYVIDEYSGRIPTAQSNDVFRKPVLDSALFPMLDRILQTHIEAAIPLDHLIHGLTD